MPVVATTAYEKASDALAFARAAIDDAYTAAGQILTGTVPGPAAPFSYQYLNEAWEFLQNELNNNGVETNIKEIILTGLTPPPVLTDPSIQATLSDAGYFNGVTATVPTPQLPVDMVEGGPLRVWERPSLNQAQTFLPMKRVFDGLPEATLNYRFFYWEWRQDQMNMPAATQSVDIRIRYNAYFPKFVQDGDPILIRRSANTLGYLTAWNYALTSGDALIADKLFQKASALIEQRALRNSRTNQHGGPVRRRGYGRRRGLSRWGH